MKHLLVFLTIVSSLCFCASCVKETPEEDLLPQPINQDSCALNVSSSVINETLENANNGAASLLVNGGQTPYYFQWSNQDTTSVISNLAPGQYSYTVTDELGCIDSGQVSVLSASSVDEDPCENFSVTSSAVDESLQNAGDGSISLTVSGGTAPYTYEWSNSSTSQNQNNLASGSYSVTVTDANNCQTNATANIQPGNPPTNTFSHDIWNTLLNNHVSNQGNVSYTGMASDIAQINAYIDLLDQNFPENSWSNNKKLAYWINVYNVHTVKIILVNWPLNSIMDISQGGNNAFDIAFINLDGNTYTLNQVENDIIRPQFNEPRIHFAVNCGAKSCPRLVNEAYTENNLQSLLQSNTIEFINNSTLNTLNANAVDISQLFNWYSVDFIQNGTVIDYINQYSNTTINSNTSITYKFYDWDLND